MIPCDRKMKEKKRKRRKKKMRALLLLVFVVESVLCRDFSAPALDDELIEKINKTVGLGWTAGVNLKFVGWSKEKAFLLVNSPFPTSLGAPLDLPLLPPPSTFPPSFDWRDQTPMCVHAIRDQGVYPSSWAISTTRFLSDRFCILSHGEKLSVSSNPRGLSIANVASCGSVRSPWSNLINPGIVSAKCWPWGGLVVPCRDSSCENSGIPWIRYRVQNGTRKHLVGLTEIISDLSKNGPQTTEIKVYEDFYTYKKGVYTHGYGGEVGKMNVRLVGWGVDETTKQKYWICANSWGKEWAMEGYFWILRGINECGIEANVHSALPDLNSGF